MSGRRVLVTGASRGIGRAVASAFAALGDRVAIHHRDSSSLAEGLRASLPGGPHPVVQADLADPAAVQSMVDGAAAALGGLDVLVNNAGVFTAHPVMSSSYEQWQAAWRRTLDCPKSLSGVEAEAQRPLFPFSPFTGRRCPKGG